MATPVVEQKSPRSLLMRSQTFTQGEQYTAAVNRATAICCTALEMHKSEYAQHKAIATWAVQCCQTFGFSPLGIQDAKSWQNRFLIEQLHTFVSESSYAQSLWTHKDSDMPLPSRILRNANHQNCRVCQFAQTWQTKVEKRFFKMLLPEEEYRGPLGVPLRSDATS